MQFDSRLAWTLKVSTVPSNLGTPRKASEDPSVKVGTEVETNGMKATLRSGVSREFP